MGVPKATTFMIALVLGSFFIVAINLYIGGLSTQYSTSFDNTTLARYNYLDNLSTSIEKTQDESTTIGTSSGALDVLGDFFSGAYQALQVTFGSVGVFLDMLTYGLSDLGLGAITHPLFLTLSSIVLILVVIGILVAAAVKRDL